MSRLVMVTYDICDPKRLRKVFKTMKGFGQHLQLSVFICELTDVERLDLKAELSRRIAPPDDQVLIVDLGPATTRGPSIESLGRAFHHTARGARIV